MAWLHGPAKTDPAVSAKHTYPWAHHCNKGTAGQGKAGGPTQFQCVLSNQSPTRCTATLHCGFSSTERCMCLWDCTKHRPNQPAAAHWRQPHHCDSTHTNMMALSAECRR
jgi:hypothetical protein